MASGEYLEERNTRMVSMLVGTRVFVLALARLSSRMAPGVFRAVPRARGSYGLPSTLLGGCGRGEVSFDCGSKQRLFISRDPLAHSTARTCSRRVSRDSCTVRHCCARLPGCPAARLLHRGGMKNSPSCPSESSGHRVSLAASPPRPQRRASQCHRPSSSCQPAAPRPARARSVDPRERLDRIHSCSGGCSTAQSGY